MAQITTKVFETSFLYDFSLNGGAVGNIALGGAIVGGNTIVQIKYTAITALVTAAVNIDAGYGLAGAVGFIKAAHTVAAINAAVGFWLLNDTWNFRKVAVGSTSDCGIYLSTPNVITAGKLLFSFTCMQHPM